VIRAALLVALAALPAGAQDWQPQAPAGAAQTAARTDPAGFHGVAIGPASPGSAPPEARMQGARTRTAWRAPPGAGRGALDLLGDLRTQLEAAGFETVFTCSGTDCGGFDFRRARPVLPMPDMVVDLGGFSYLAARRGPEGAPDALAGVLASAGPAGAYAQLTLIAPQPAAPAREPAAPGTEDGTPPPPSETSDAARPTTAQAVAEAFAASGRLVLDGVAFGAGEATMGATPPMLRALADWLAADPARRVALVGHTDWTGAAEMNVALSRQRAQAVADALTGRLGADPAQISVAGAGPYAPRAPNATEEGRAANRRVEAVALAPAR